MRRLALALLLGAVLSTTPGGGAFPGRATPQLSAKEREELASLPFCAAGRRFSLPPELVAGVYLAERELNRTALDGVQDQIFALLHAKKDEAWWASWAERSMQAAEQQEAGRALSNKWPPDVIRTGIVVSIGPAQITPRTALKACSALATTLPACATGVRSLIGMLLDRSGSVDLAAAVLRYEADAEQAREGRDLSGDLGLWAAIYNFGGDFYRQAFADARPVNEFGRWVARRADAIKVALDCEAIHPP